MSLITCLKVISDKKSIFNNSLFFELTSKTKEFLKEIFAGSHMGIDPGAQMVVFYQVING